MVEVLIGEVNHQGKDIDGAEFRRMLKNPRKIHSKDLPPLPRHHGDVKVVRYAEHLQVDCGTDDEPPATKWLS